MNHLVVFSGVLMRGQAEHWRLEGTSFLEEVRTVPCYRLFSISDRYPALVRDEIDGMSIAAELYIVPDTIWSRIRSSFPPGIFSGPVELSDGRVLTGELGEMALVSQFGIDISTHGSWPAYLASLHQRQFGAEPTHSLL